ncbi:MAG: NAD-dependent epimerase/dehydratase family protein [Pseudomonadota bacterium]
MTMSNQSGARLTTLVVGGGGFIGSHFVQLLQTRGERNVIVAGRGPKPRFPLPVDVHYVQGDAADPVFIGGLLERCDEIVDLAYATVPKTSFEDPVHDVLVNLPATVNLLRQASRCKLRRVLLVSSGGTVYGNAAYLPIDEMHPTNPVSPYGITKLAAEKYALLFHRLEELPVVIVRPGNPYGPNQLGNLGQGFVGAAMFATLKRQPVSLFGECGTIRDYVFVEDLAEGLLAALDHGHVGELYNIGSGIGFDNREVLGVLDSVARPYGFSVDVEVRPSRTFDVAANVLSSARLTYISGWRPQTDFKAGLEKTWSWALTTGAAL